MLDPRLLEILVCPACRGELVLVSDPPALLCHECSLCFEVRDGIPILLIEEARPIEPGGPPPAQG